MQQTSKGETRGTLRRTKPLVLCLIAILGSIVFVLGLRLFFLPTTPSDTEFHLHRVRYETIVSKIKQMGISLDKPAYFRTDSNLDAASLELDSQASSNTMVGKVCAWRTPAGHYQIVIVTRDEGHAGAFGYIYSEIPLLSGKGMKSQVPGDLCFIDHKIDPHWWIAYNDLF